MIERLAPEPADAASPCINVCVIDDATRWCVGCGRTIGEIVGWGSAGVATRRAIRGQLPERMAALRENGPSPTPRQVPNRRW
ncbi:DUF1289 domain-containing protein [Sphingomonas bacterium]|uniref:DUF1289 domain-containing protein n=1 Tax=Sphingomonas bacterium TaxID=1895847 RepID=UPI001575DA14|nr:DUF1289 domain-containing protein [Sphingomonas bacterium]